MARAAGGRLLLRIEDIDTARCRPEYETAIYEDLAWLGLHGKRRCGGNRSTSTTTVPRSTQLEAHGPDLSELRKPRRDRAHGRGARGASAWPRDPDGAPLYPGDAQDARQRANATGASMRGEPYALRLDMAAALLRAGTLPVDRNRRRASGETGIVAADPAAWGDVILARKETPTSYHLAVVVDDAAQGVTDVVRGHDLFHATSVHRLLQALLGLPQPRYRHHRLDPRRRRQQAVEIDAGHGLARAARARRMTPADIRRLVGLD